MSKATVLVSLFILVIFVTISSTSARPSKSVALSRQKRQSDQRLAELETLLALQKYGRHRFRMDRKKGVGADGEHPPGYGIIDFRMLGRKKKSTRFSPGELENSVKKVSVDAAIAADQDQRSNFHHQENHPNPYWTSNNAISNDNGNNNNSNNEESITYSENPPPQLAGEELRASVEDQIGDFVEPEKGTVPLFYLQNK